MYAYVAAATGWTWEYIGGCLTLPRLYAMYDHWKQYPPVHVSAALFAGIKSDDSKAPEPKKPVDNAAIASQMTTDPRTLKWQPAP